jgi:hypothetical protein
MRGSPCSRKPGESLRYHATVADVCPRSEGKTIWPLGTESVGGEIGEKLVAERLLVDGVAGDAHGFE